MKRGVTLIWATLILTTLISKEPIIHGESGLKQTLKSKPVNTVGTFNSLRDSLDLYVCKIDSAKNKSTIKSRVLKKTYKELKKLDSILLITIKEKQ